MAITPGVASGGFQTINDAAYETAFDATLHGGKRGMFTIYASGGAINYKATPNHSQGVNPTLKNGVCPAGESRQVILFGPSAQGLIEKLELQAVTAGAQAEWST